MKRIMICLAAMATALTLSAKGGKTSCTDAGANFTIADQSGPGLSSDGAGQYINSENGVIGRINCNGESLELSGTRHSFLLLGTPLTGGYPNWASSSAPVAFFNIPLGIKFNNAEPDPNNYTITTYFEVTMATPNLGYYFDLENPGAGMSIGLSSPSTAVNTPAVTTPVSVTHIPQVVDQFGNVTESETWVVTPLTTPAVGTLLSNLKGGLRPVGQFSTAFTITITRQ